MARVPTHPDAALRRGGFDRERVTAVDGTWPLSEDLVRALRRRPSVEQYAAPRLALGDSAREPARDVSAAPRFPRPPRPARPPDLPSSLQARWKEVLDRHDALADLDHFALLEIPYEAGIQHVHRAFAEQIKRYHPDQLADEIEALRPYAMRIVARLNEARLVLSDRCDRESYLRSLGRMPAAQQRTHEAPSRPLRVAVQSRGERGVSAIAAREQRLRSRRPSAAPASPGAKLLRSLRRRGQ